MEKNTELLKKFVKLMESKNDPDAVMGLRGAQNLFQSKNAKLGDALLYAAAHMDQWQKAAPEEPKHPTKEAAAVQAGVNLSEVPECRLSRPGVLEVIPVGNAVGDMYQLPGEAAKAAETVALHMKDAIVAAVVNRSRFKIKLNDVRNRNGDIVETILQAEYDRPGMMPVQIWTNNRGEVGALATVLRKMMARSLPELLAG